MRVQTIPACSSANQPTWPNANTWMSRCSMYNAYIILCTTLCLRAPPLHLCQMCWDRLCYKKTWSPKYQREIKVGMMPGVLHHHHLLYIMHPQNLISWPLPSNTPKISWANCQLFVLNGYRLTGHRLLMKGDRTLANKINSCKTLTGIHRTTNLMHSRYGLVATHVGRVPRGQKSLLTYHP